jgi:hypothetical protein
MFTPLEGNSLPTLPRKRAAREEPAGRENPPLYLIYMPGFPILDNVMRSMAVKAPVIVFLFLTLFLGACSRGPAVGDDEITSRIRNILELPTAEYRYKDIVHLGNTKSFLFFTTVDKELLFSVDLRVQAGIDFNDELTIYRDKGDPERIFVGLPPAKILLVDADEKSIHQYFSREQGDRFGRLEFADEIAKAKPGVEKDAVSRGILRKADDAAKDLVRGFLRFLGFKSIEFLPSEVPRKGLRG